MSSTRPSGPFKTSVGMAGRAQGQRRRGHLSDGLRVGIRLALREPSQPHRMNVHRRLPVQNKLRHDDARARAHPEAVSAEARSDKQSLYPGASPIIGTRSGVPSMYPAHACYLVSPSVLMTAMACPRLGWLCRRSSGHHCTGHAPVSCAAHEAHRVIEGTRLPPTSGSTRAWPDCTLSRADDPPTDYDNIVGCVPAGRLWRRCEDGGHRRAFTHRHGAVHCWGPNVPLDVHGQGPQLGSIAGYTGSRRG